MITVFARFIIQEEKEATALDALSKMADDVKANEPGCLVYLISRGQVIGREIFIYEVYADEAAFEAHRKTNHMLELQAAFSECIDRSSFKVEGLTRTAGFIRSEAASA